MEGKHNKKKKLTEIKNERARARVGERQRDGGRGVRERKQKIKREKESEISEWQGYIRKVKKITKYKIREIKRKV